MRQLALLFVPLLLALACGDDDSHEEQHAEVPAICEELGELCHDADTGSGLGAECHELGHVGDAAVCEARYDECVTYCESVLGAGGQAGAGGSGGAGGQ